MNGVFVTLIKREFWENKSLWIAPLAVVGLMITGATFAHLHSGPGGGIVITPDSAFDTSQTLGAMSLTGIVAFLSLVTGFAVFAYLLDCMFSERRDRSILFWKSLPVSDAQTVLAKLTVAMLVLPLGMILLALLTQPVVALISWLRFEQLRPYIDFGLFAAWPGTLARLGVVWAFTVLWFAPIATYLMLASVLAKRAPLVYAVLPPLVLILGEKLILDSAHAGRFIGARLFPWPSRLQDLLGPVPRKNPGPVMVESHWWIPFQDPNLWLGLAVAVGMLYIVIRMRRYRDDT